MEKISNLLSVVQKTVVTLAKLNASKSISSTTILGLSRISQLPLLSHFKRSYGNMLQIS